MNEPSGQQPYSSSCARTPGEPRVSLRDEQACWGCHSRSLLKVIRAPTSEWPPGFADEHVDGCYVQNLHCTASFTGGRLIFVDTNRSGYEQAYVLLHELGHWVFDLFLGRTSSQGTADRRWDWVWAWTEWLFGFRAHPASEEK